MPDAYLVLSNLIAIVKSSKSNFKIRSSGSNLVFSYLNYYCKIPTKISFLSFFRRPWWRPPGRWRRRPWRWPQGRWWAWSPRLVGQIWSTNPYWLPCNCGKSIKPRELAGNVYNQKPFVHLTRFFLPDKTLRHDVDSSAIPKRDWLQKDDKSWSLPDQANNQTKGALQIGVWGEIHIRI